MTMTYFEAIITLIGLPTEPNIFPFISSRANAASDVLENLMYVTPKNVNNQLKSGHTDIHAA